MATNLPQASKGSQHMNFALVEAFLGDGFHHLLAAPTQFGEVELPLFLAELAIAPLFDTVGQVLGDVLLEPADQQWTQLRGQPASGDALRGFGILATRFVSL